ncbi:ComF family protein [Candidatus Gracilibacteria bacterium]|nr:ComF family protein [Candidatus Gracilibacteria bacterium]
MKWIFDLLFPKKCLGCGAAGEFLCSGCGLVSRVERISWGGALDELIVCTHYSGAVRKLIKQLKYKFSQEVVSVLGEVLRAGYDGGVLVAVPLSVKRMKYRGFNQAELLALELGEVFKCLCRVRDTESQAKLSAGGRKVNLKGAFCVTEDVSGMDLLLVDDVSTTGSTLEECAGVLKRAGAKRVRGIVVASGK